MNDLKKKTLWKDIKKCFSKSKGRFFSILCLVALGSFALVGLQVAGPDMRKTGENYFNRLKLADISIIGDYGIDKENETAINKVSGAEKIEYGYLKDVVIADTNTSIRVFSETDGISEYEVVNGRMPEADNEIAIASFFSDQYSISDTIEFSEKEDIAGNKALKNHKLKIVGFVNSSELLSIINMGQSTAGTGELQGYAVVTKEAFDSEVYMIARLSFIDTKGVDPYSTEYTNLIGTHKDELNNLLADQPSARLASIKNEYQTKIDDAQTQINDAKAKLDDSLSKLTDADKELADAKQKYNSGLSEYNTKKADAESQFKNAENKISSARSQIANAEKELTAKNSEFNQAKDELKSARNLLDTKWSEYNEKASQLESLKQTKVQLDSAQANLDVQIKAAEQAMGMTIEQIEAALPTLQAVIPQAQYEQLVTLVNAKNDLDSKWATYNSIASQLSNADQQLASARSELEKSEAEYSAKQSEIEAAQTKLTAAETELSQKRQELKSAEDNYAKKKAEANSELANAKLQLDDAAAKISESENELSDKWDEYNQKRPDADKEISDAEKKVNDAQSALDRLKQPVYALDTRREIPGSQGYLIYSVVSDIVDSLANIFPIFLYFVAALVTLTTITRFVDEERINSGTLKALGYDNHDIVKKFTVYSLAAGTTGAILGIITGHTLLPMIVYNAYGKSFTYPRIELHFYPAISIIALLLALLCTVVPAFIVAHKELMQKPYVLLQPKPPESGSKIFLERITPIWSRMNFTHKVTARNIFRYKKRMLMTIFGVCGSVTLIFAGFSVQHSISGVKDRQFGDIMKYDLIVAENDGLDEEQSTEIDTLLASNEIESQVPIHYETVSKIAGKNNDSQEITLIVPNEASALSDYIRLYNRSSGESIELSDEGCVITERLAKLLGVKIGDTFEINDDENNPQTVKVSAITEMYTKHFIFMNRNYYESAFSEGYNSNARFVTLKDRSSDNAKIQASRFMELNGVKGVVQNTTLTNQIDTIVQSLNRIMQILIIVATLLAVVILYNLTNINVSERIRELSTIKVLGFYNKEVTMYIYRETILLTLIGILVGFGFGDLLYQYIITVVPPDDVMFNPALGATAFIVPVIVITIITLVLGIMMNRRLKNVDMLEALKSVE